MKFSQKMTLYVFYTMVQKSQKWPKTQIKGGSCLNKRLKWNGSTTSSFGTTAKGNTPLHLQVKPSCQHVGPIYAVAFTYFSFRLWWETAGYLLWFIHARIIREFSTIRAAGRELFDSHKMSIRFTPTFFRGLNIVDTTHNQCEMITQSQGQQFFKRH